MGAKVDEVSDVLSRNLRGYGEFPPDPKWPGNARVALNFVMNFEEGSEYSLLDGDDHTESNLLEVASSRVPFGQRDLAAESMYEYGVRVGFWRLRRLFVEREIPLTIFACAQALERHPDAAAAIARETWDICCHGWRWNEQYLLSEEEQRTQIADSIASLRRTVGRAPSGWYCRYAPSQFTRKLLIEQGSFLYDSDAYNDDLPYWVGSVESPHLVVPYSLALNDTKILRGGLSTGAQFFEYLREALDQLLEEGRETPKMMSVGMHLRILGHPGRAAGLKMFLDYVKSQPDVWLCRREDIARHWIERFPAAEVLREHASLRSASVGER
jgi:peptidoglycan/xylan/chitin deacetylase (PgdA/CDA1 family)